MNLDKNKVSATQKDYQKLVDMGFWLFPLKINAKTPLHYDYKSNASNSLPLTNTNVGIDLGRFGKDGEWNLVVIDIDVHKDAKGFETFRQLKEDGFHFPETFNQITASGGQHLVYKTKSDHPLKFRMGDGLDLLCYTRYIVGAGSIVDGGFYTSNWQEVAEVPSWILEKYKADPLPKKKEVNVTDIDQGRALKSAKEYLEHCDVAVEGSGGEHLTFVIAAKLCNLGLEEESAYELMLGSWNEKCLPPWDADELRVKVANGYRYAKGGFGSESIEAQFDKVEKIEKIHSKDHIDFFNEKYCMIAMGAKTIVVQKQVENDDMREFPQWTKLVFKDLWMDKFFYVKTDKGQRKRYMVDDWYQSARLEKYFGITFNPGKNNHPELYNLWRGFAYKPKKVHNHRGVELFLDHIKRNACGGDEGSYKWLINWYAHMFQYPEEKPRTCTIFKGVKGCGKNYITDTIAELVGSRHSFITSDDRYLLSHFNQHLATRLYLVLNEAFWSGNRQSDSMLKSLITEKTKNIEMKHHEAQPTRCYLRINLISNEDQVVNYTRGSRRYAIFQFVDKNVEEEVVEIERYRDDDFLSALMDLFLNFPVDKALVNAPPHNKGSEEERTNSFLPHEQWIDSVLKDESFGMQNDEGEYVWTDTVDKKHLHRLFLKWVDDNRLTKFQGNLLNDVHFARWLRKTFPEFSTIKPFKKPRLWVVPPVGDLKARWVSINSFPNDYFESDATT